MTIRWRKVRAQATILGLSNAFLLHRTDIETPTATRAMRLHSWLSPKCSVANARSGGLGVFAVEPLASHELVAVWGGVIYDSNEIQQLSSAFPHMHTQAVQVVDGFHLASTSATAIDDAERFNHSCNPNVGIKGQIVVLARRSIAPGEELTYDYETTDLHPGDFDCRCESARCRRRIAGGAWRQAEFQQLNQEWLSWHIGELVRLQNRK